MPSRSMKGREPLGGDRMKTYRKKPEKYYPHTHLIREDDEWVEEIVMEREDQHLISLARQKKMPEVCCKDCARLSVTTCSWNDLEILRIPYELIICSFFKPKEV